MIWSSVASDSSASIVRSLVPKSQDLGIAKIGFSQRLTRTPGKGLCKSSAFCHSERISRTLPSLFKPSPKTPRAQGHLFTQREKKDPWLFCYLLFGYDEQQLGISTWTIILNPWQVWARPPSFLFNSVEKLKQVQVRSFWPLQPKRIIYHKKSRILFLRLGGWEGYVIKSF